MSTRNVWQEGSIRPNTPAPMIRIDEGEETSPMLGKAEPGDMIVDGQQENL